MSIRWRARSSAIFFGAPCSTSPYITLPSTVFQGNSANSWNTGPRSGPGPVTGAPFTRTDEAANDVKQCRFAAAGRPEDRDELAFGHVERNVAERQMAGCAGGVETLRQPLDCDHTGQRTLAYGTPTK